MQPIYHSTVFACETSDDGRRVRCDFRHCNLHFRGEKDYVWLLNTTQNVKLLEKHVGEEIEKFMTDQKIEFPKTIGEWNRDETKIQKIESTTRKVLVIFELDEPHASVGKWLEKFVTAACLELHLIDICVVTKTFRSRRELLRVIRHTGIELNSQTIQPLEVIVLLSCHSSSQGQVFSCTPSSITQKCEFEEFCSLHDFVCTCQDSLGRLLKGIHVSSCFALKLDASHKFWPVDAQWIRRHLTCVVSGSVKEVYETGSQAADLHLALESLLGTSSSMTSSSSSSNMRNLKDVVEEARQRSFPDLAEEMGLRIMNPDKVEEELERESINDEVHPRPLVTSDVCVVFLADKSDLSSCCLGDALATSLRLRPDVKSDIIVISVDLGEDSMTSRAKKPRRDIEAILERCLVAVWTQEKPVFLIVLGSRLSHLKSHVVKATRPDKIFGIHFANLPPPEAETSSLDFDVLNSFVTGTTDGKFVKHPGHAALYPLLLYMIQLATGENGSRLAPSSSSSTGKSVWNAQEVFKEVSHVMEGLSGDCQFRILRSKSKDLETKNPEEKFRASQSDTSSDILDIERLDDDKQTSSTSKSRTNDLPLSANVREVLVRHFILDLSIDFSSHVIGGTIVLFLEEKERFSSVHLCLDACDLVIERVEEIDPLLTPPQSSLSFEDRSECFGYEKCCEIVKLNGSALRYEMTEWKMNIFAPENRTTKFPRCVKIVYHTKATGKSLAWANDVNNRPCVFNWGAPINNRAMFPGQDVPGGLSTWNAIARVPKGCLVLMSGNFYENHSLPKDDFECHFYAMECLLPCCCVGFAAGYFVASLCESASWSSAIPCRLFAAESQLPAVAKEFRVNLPKYLSAACAILGPFPYVRIDVIILPRSFGCMGLASPNLVFLSPSVVSGDGSMSVRIGHEISHAWFGCSIGPKDWTEEWLTEGFATYCEDVIEAIALEWPLNSWENRFGLKAVIKWKTLVGEIENTAQTKELLRKEERTSRGHTGSSVKNALNPDKRFLQIHYVKGYFLLRYMASKIGVLEFNKVLKAYTTKFRSSLVKSQDFFDVFFDLYPSSKCSEFSSETLTRDWLQSPTVPIKYSDVTSNNSLFNASLEQIEYWRKVDRKNQRKSSPKKPWETTTLPLSDQLIVALEGLLELKKLHRSTLTQLNRCYKFASQNADIRHRWCELIIKHLHRRAFGDVRRFLTEDQGMGVYLYGELMCSEDDKAIALARAIFDDVKDEMDYETRLVVSEMVYG